MFCCAALYEEPWPPLAPPPFTLQWSTKGPFPCLLHSAFDNSLDQTGEDTLEMTVTHLSAPGGPSRAGGSCFEFIALSIRRPEVALLPCTIDSSGHRAWFLCLLVYLFATANWALDCICYSSAQPLCYSPPPPCSLKLLRGQW